MWVVGYGVMDVLTTCYPDEVRVGPDQSDEFLRPDFVDDGGRSAEVEVLEDHPVSRDEASCECVGSKVKLLAEDFFEDCFMGVAVDYWIGALCRCAVVVCRDEIGYRVDD